MIHVIPDWRSVGSSSWSEIFMSFHTYWNNRTLVCSSLWSGCFKNSISCIEESASSDCSSYSSKSSVYKSWRTIACHYFFSKLINFHMIWIWIMGKLMISDKPTFFGNLWEAASGQCHDFPCSAVCPSNTVSLDANETVPLATWSIRLVFHNSAFFILNRTFQFGHFSSTSPQKWPRRVVHRRWRASSW